MMLYAVIMRFDSLREITTSLLAETRKLAPRDFLQNRTQYPCGRQSKTLQSHIRGNLPRFIRHLPTRPFIGQPEPKDTQMDETATDYRLHDHHIVLQSAVQGSRTTSKDWQEERRNKSTCGNTRQRRRYLRHKVHVSSHKRLVHAQADNALQGGHNGHGPRLYRL